MRAYEGAFDAEGFDLGSFTTLPVTDRKQGVQLFASTASAEGDATTSGWLVWDRQDLATELEFEILTGDVEYRRTFAMTESYALTAGLGARVVSTDLDGEDPSFLDFDPSSSTQLHTRAFVDNRFALSETLEAVLGAQLEVNDFTGLEVQPTGRLSWNPSPGFGVWAAVTRSVLTSSLEEVHLSDTSALVGNRDFQSENALAYELGVRKSFGNVASLDIATFYNDLDDLHTSSGGEVANDGAGESYGLEVAFDVHPTERRKLRSAYTFLDGDYVDEQAGLDLPTDQYHPRHLFNVRSY